MSPTPTLATLRHVASDELRDLMLETTASFPAGGCLQHALATAGKLLGPSPDDGLIWGLLPLFVCQSAGGDPLRALPLAAAVDCLLAATDILDDIEDGDDPEALVVTYGLPTATNVATLLLFLSQAALGRLHQADVPPARIVAAGQALAIGGIRACGGQQHDLTPDPAQIDVDSYLSLIGPKAGGLVEGICRAGALLATDESAVVGAYAECGFQMGLALQIGNDLRGLARARAVGEAARPDQYTIPLLFARQHPPAAPLVGTSDAASGHLAALATSGALAYATVIADICWERAMDALGRATRERACPLRDLIGRLRGD